MGWKGALGLILCALALALIGWGLLFLPAQTIQIKIDLPPAATPSRDPAPIKVEILADGSIRVEGAPSTLDNLPRDIAAKASSPPGTQEITILADKDVSYAAYTAVLERCSAAGWTKVGLVNE